MSEIFHVLRSDQFDKKFLDELYAITNNLRKISRTKRGADYLRKLMSEKGNAIFHTALDQNLPLFFECLPNTRHADIRNQGFKHILRNERGNSGRRHPDFQQLRRYDHHAFTKGRACTVHSGSSGQDPRRVPVINGGSGKDEHPTQALLDIYTLRRSFGKTEAT